MTTIDLRPIEWFQEVENYPSINVEGRRFRAHCRAIAGPQLNTKATLDEFLVEIQIVEHERMMKQLSELPDNSLGMFHFYESQDYEQGGFIAGWFVLNRYSLQDAWMQVLHGNYESCLMQFGVHGDHLTADQYGSGFQWNVKDTSALYIERVTVQFRKHDPALKKR